MFPYGLARNVALCWLEELLQDGLRSQGVYFKCLEYLRLSNYARLYKTKFTTTIYAFNVWLDRYMFVTKSRQNC